MSRKSIVYHTRDIDGNKVGSGTFGGEFTQENVNRLVDRLFSFAVGPNDEKPHLVDRQGRRVTLYVQAQIDAIPAYQEVLKEHRKQLARRAFEASDCIYKDITFSRFSDCSDMFNCCDCGGDGCGCAYCWSCHACDACSSNC